MTTEVVDTRAERAEEIEREIINGCQATRFVWVGLAAKLHEFHFQKMWEERGCDTFEEWIATPEISLGRSSTYALIQIHEELVLKRGIDPKELAMEPSKIAQIIPALKRGEVAVEDALADVEALSRSDLREKYGKGSGGGSGPRLVECEQCGRQRKADPEPTSDRPDEQIEGQMEIEG